MEVVKNEKQLVNEHCQREKLPNPNYICTPDQEKTPNGFFCTLTVNGQTFCTSNWQKSKKNAELEAAKLACKKLNIVQTKSDKTPAAKNVINEDEPTPLVPAAIGKPGQPEGKQPDWITIEKVEDIYKYLTDEVLAQEFRSFLYCKAQGEKKPYPTFTHTEVKDNGFTAVVTYDEKQYNSLGFMMTKKQAEQSASEMCLRALGDFPAVSDDKYTIQIYKGDVSKQKKKIDK